MSNKTVEYLNTKAWYRALKVVNFFFVIVCFGVATAATLDIFEDHNYYNFDWWVAPSLGLVLFSLAWLMSQIPKWIFYYIVLGKIKPKKYLK